MLTASKWQGPDVFPTFCPWSFHQEPINQSAIITTEILLILLRPLFSLRLRLWQNSSLQIMNIYKTHISFPISSLVCYLEAVGWLTVSFDCVTMILYTAQSRSAQVHMMRTGLQWELPKDVVMNLGFVVFPCGVLHKSEEEKANLRPDNAKVSGIKSIQLTVGRCISK